MKYFVSRQRYWGVPEAEAYVVEIATGGREYANPDALVPKYAGEMEEYDDPREAAEAAISIMRQWKKDARRKIHVAYGCTFGYTMPFEPSTIKDLRAWAETAYKELPKCERCGMLVDADEYYTDAFGEGMYCQCCAEHFYGEEERLEPTAG